MEKAIEILEDNEKVVFVKQTQGPPTLSGAYHEFLAPYNQQIGLRISQVLTSRCFLFSKAKLEDKLLPIYPLKWSIVRRCMGYTKGRVSSPYMALETMISETLKRKAYYQCELESDFGFSLHAWNKKVFSNLKIEQVIQDIELGKVPESQRGLVNLEFEKW